MTTLNRDAGRAAVAAGIRAGTDVTGFGLLGHLYKMARASGVTAVVDAAAVPSLAGAREALAEGFVSGGTRRNLDWVRPFLDAGRVEDRCSRLPVRVLTAVRAGADGQLCGRPRRPAAPRSRRTRASGARRHTPPGSGCCPR